MILRTCSKNSPCGYITLQTSGRVARVNRTLLGWTGYTADAMVGKRFSNFVMAGRIYYETHIAPLLRMQGFFNEFAIEMISAKGEPIQMICNALEGRDAAGKPLFTRLAILKATDRRRYEQELLQAREAAKTSLEIERETSELREQFIAVLGHDLRNPLFLHQRWRAHPRTECADGERASGCGNDADDSDAYGRTDRQRA
jgi:sigma-B regulation protein RsbU (phosphoserine phosphatase)